MIKCGDVDGKGMRCIYAYPDRPKCSCWLDWPDIATIDANHDCHCPDLRSARLKEQLGGEWSEVERRAEVLTQMTELFSRGWLVTLKTSPKGFLANDPWNGESDAVVDVKWWAEACYIIGRISNDTDETRKYINAHPYGSGDTAEEAMAELAKQVEELNALADAAREEDV